MAGPSKGYVLTGLLQHNYFPAHKEEMSEMPPALSSADLTPEVARLLVAAGNPRGQYGYDCISYRASRFDGASRLLQIPHPAAYSALALLISENWQHLSSVVDNPSSRIRPSMHPDGRLLVMNYEDTVVSARRELSHRRGQRYLARADIANCYGSIYSHSIGWAAVGHEAAKRAMGRDLNWYNRLDKAVRGIRRNETQGIPIGPGTSSVVAEFVLERIDSELRNQGFEFCRYIDDYMAYCRTEEEASRFIRCTEDALALYKLTLSRKKTEVLRLPQPIRPQWLHELSLLAPRDEPLSTFDVYNYLDMALGMSVRHAGGSVLKYAVKTLLAAKRDHMAKRALVEYTIELALHSPVLIPLLGKMIEELAALGQPVGYWTELNDLAEAAIKARCSDSTAWCLYYLRKIGGRVSDSVVDAILDSGDCAALTMLYWTGQMPARQAIIDYARNLAASSTTEYGRYDLDAQWLLLYQLYRDRRMGNPYKGDPSFKILRSAGVSFLHD